MSSTISGLRSVRQPSNEEGWYRGGLEGNKGRRADYFSLVNSTDMNPDNKYKAYQLLNPHHHAIYVVDMDCAQQENFEFYQTLNGCVIWFNTIPKECSRKQGHPHQGQGRETRKDSRRGCTHPVKQIVCVGSVEKTRSASIAQVL